MVFFTCNHCGASLKKDKVEKHYNLVCRNAVSVSCLDCTKDFGEKDYDAHRSCITENEKYGGKNFVPKPSFNKGARKQEAWIELVQSIKDTEQNLSAVDREFLDGLSKHENVPQKKRKFQNFATSVFHDRFKSHVVDRIWDIMEQKKALLISSNADKNNKNENKDTENGTTEQSSDKGEENKTIKKQKKEKQKREESTNDTSTESTPADSEVNGEEKLSKKEEKEKHKKEKLNEENEVKLSKKERKEKRKREKLLNSTGEAPSEDISAEKENEDSAEKENEDSAEKENEDAAISDGQQLNEENVEVKLSKKEMKEKRKREKYEAELKQIENHQMEDMEIDNDEDDGKKKKKKKALKVMEVDDTSELVQNGDVNNAKQKKKNKKQAKEGNVLVEEEKLEIVEGEEVTSAVLKSKQRKRQTEDDESEIPVSKKHKNIYSNGNTDLLEDHEDEKTSGKFNWQETILKVLETKGELSLKKLQKKVITEYQNSGTCRETMDKAVAKFNKKVLKIPGIKVHKEVVSLLS